MRWIWEPLLDSRPIRNRGKRRSPAKHPGRARYTREKVNNMSPFESHSRVDPIFQAFINSIGKGIDISREAERRFREERIKSMLSNSKIISQEEQEHE